jgi:hypothetical protein
MAGLITTLESPLRIVARRIRITDQSVDVALVIPKDPFDEKITRIPNELLCLRQVTQRLSKKPLSRFELRDGKAQVGQ